MSAPRLDASNRLRANRLAMAVVVSLLSVASAHAAVPTKSAGPEGASTAVADPILAYQYNTSNWAFASSSDAYRAMSRADPRLEGLNATLQARIFLAYNLSTLGRGAEAQGTLDEAQRLLNASRGELSALDQRLLAIDLLIGRSVADGNLASKSTGETRRANFEDSAKYAAQAAALTQASLAPEQAATGKSVAIDPVASLSFNTGRASGRGVGGVIPRAMTADEKLAELEARADYSLCAARIGLGQNEAASKANLSAGVALQRLTSGFALWLRSLVADQRSELQFRSGDAQSAKRSLTLAISTMQQSHGFSRPEAYLWRRMAAVDGKLSDPVGQRAAEEKSFAILVAQTDGAPPNRDEVASYQALLAPSAAAGNAVDVAKFFEVSSLAIETQTASTIADVALRLASGDSPSARAIRHFQDARRGLDVAAARVARVHDATPPAAEVQIRLAEDDLDQAQADVATASAEARKVAGSRADAVISPKAQLSTVQAALAPNEAYVRFVFLKNGAGYAILIRSKSARVVGLPITQAQASAAIYDLRSPMRAVEAGGIIGGANSIPAFKLSTAAKLYQDLFGGISTDLADVSSLVIEPAGPLFALPFGALLVTSPDKALVTRWIASGGADYRGAPWLARSKSVELSVGAAGFVRLRGVRPSQAPKALLAFANPMPSLDAAQQATSVAAQRETRGFSLARPTSATPGSSPCAAEAREILGFPALPDTLTEASAAARAVGENPSTAVVSGAAFTDDAVLTRQDLASYRILLFATHAALPDRERCWPDPFLIATKGKGANSQGLLEVGSLATLKLDANLVVLSACNTAAGDAGGQALGGLAQSFLFAGTRSVIVSHWSVDSRATAGLISGLFSGIHDGARAGDALATAERKMMDDPELSHPYFWAAFTVVGEPSLTAAPSAAVVAAR